MSRSPLILALVLASAASADPISADWPGLFGRPAEVAVYPAQALLSLDRRQIGVGGVATLHLHPRFGLQVSGFYNYVTSPVLNELTSSLRYEPTDPGSEARPGPPPTATPVCGRTVPSEAASASS